LAELVRSGRTSLEIAREFAEAPEQLEALVNAAARGVEPKPGAPEPAGAFGKDLFAKANKLFGNERK
jgi:twitching motility protein PilT